MVSAFCYVMKKKAAALASRRGCQGEDYFAVRVTTLEGAELPQVFSQTATT